MGLFSSKEVVTSTTSYNLRGEYNPKDGFVKSMVVGNVMRPNPDGFGSSIQSGLINGPGVRLRNFQRWALNNYGAIGTPGEVRVTAQMIVREVIENAIGGNITLQGIETALGNYSYWAEQYMMENHQELLGTGWVADISEDDNLITILFEDESTESFTPSDFDPNSYYIYCTYYLRSEEEVRLYFYRMGSNVSSSLETLMTVDVDGDSLFPIIPIRLKEKFLSETYMSSAYALSKKALKKAIGVKLDKLIGTLEDENEENLGDIDYAYVTFGTALNNPAPEAKSYMYLFFEEMADKSEIGAADLVDWEDRYASSVSDQLMLQAWEESDADDPFYNPDPPVRHTAPPSRPFNSLVVRAPGGIDINYDVRYEWAAITKISGNGLQHNEAKVGDVWWEINGAREFSFTFGGKVTRFTKNKRANNLVLYRQTSEDLWEALKIDELVQKTYVYKNHYAKLDADDAILDAEAGEECSFIIPLKMSVFNKMSLVDQTEFASSCSYLTLHAYEIYKKKWYETFLFKIVLVAAIVGITAITGGFGAGAVGILGTNISVGVTLGLSGTAAIIAGAAANMLASMIITTIITQAATEVFGAELGAIIGTLAAVATINGLTSLASTGSFAANFGQLTQASNLIKMSDALVRGYSSYLNAETQGVMEDTQDLVKIYEEKSEEIDRMYTELLGYGNNLLDPMLLVSPSSIVESPDVFLSRTLMTGSDIAEISIDSVSNFSELTLSVNLPLQ